MPRCFTVDSPSSYVEENGLVLKLRDDVIEPVSPLFNFYRSSNHSQAYEIADSTLNVRIIAVSSTVGCKLDPLMSHSGGVGCAHARFPTVTDSQIACCEMALW